MNDQDHISGLGTLISHFHTLEFLLRAVLKNHENNKSNINYAYLKLDEVVPLDPMTNYDSLGVLIDKYNELVADDMKISKGIVDIRDAIAHGRVFSENQNFPLKLNKFNRPNEEGKVTVKFAETLDQCWFKERHIQIYEAIEKAIKVNEKIESR